MNVINNSSWFLRFFRAPIAYTIVLLFFQKSGVSSFMPLFFIFGVIPILDILLPRYITNPSSLEEEEKLKKSKIFDFLIWSMVVIHIFFVLRFLVLFHENYKTESLFTLSGWVISIGLGCGVFGINIGHELGHRIDSWQRFLGKIALLSSLRMSFYIEHNWGHHADVSTDKDPASAKKNEIVYFFIPKSIFKTWLNAWVIQKELLIKRKASFFSIYNDILWYLFIQWGTVASIALIFNWQTAVAFIIAALIGMILLELINYIEHYGLRRDKNEKGIYERVLPIHSWNSDHNSSSSALFNLSRHSDHHYIASRPYQILRTYETVPNMPTGYAGMILLSLIPPLWFYIMNKKLNEVTNLSKQNFSPTT